MSKKMSKKMPQTVKNAKNKYKIFKRYLIIIQ